MNNLKPKESVSNFIFFVFFAFSSFVSFHIGKISCFNKMIHIIEQEQKNGKSCELECIKTELSKLKEEL